MGHLRDWSNSVLGMVFPENTICPICGKKENEVKQKGICQQCVSHILTIAQTEEVCPRCGFFTAGEACPNCRYWGNSELKVGSVVPYDGIFREMIHELKYNKKKENALPIGYLMACRVKELGIGGTIEAIVPVPLYIGREAERGFNQSLLLAKVIAEELHKPIWKEALERSHFHHTQTVLGRKERMENLAGAFEFAGKQKQAAASVLLVDDIITTGATLLSCANALETNGVQRIYGIAWAAGFSIKMMKRLAGNNFYHGEYR